MTNREQAIKRVTEETKGCDGLPAFLVAYAVDTTERVLELEAREAELLRAVSAGNETVLDLKARLLELEEALRDCIELLKTDLDYRDGGIVQQAWAALQPKGE